MGRTWVATGATPIPALGTPPALTRHVKERWSERIAAALDLSGEDLVHVVLGTLAFHLPAADAERLAALVPDDLRLLLLLDAAGPAGWNRRAFLDDLAESLEVDVIHAERIALVVLNTLGVSLGGTRATREFFALLPKSLRPA